MKLAILNDTHAGIRNSSEIFLDNAEKFFGMPELHTHCCYLCCQPSLLLSGQDLEL